MDQLQLLSFEGFEFLLRWLHFLAGITWIGILYYFNFIQGAFMAEASPEAKRELTLKLLPRALWWFRWGAMFTVAAGLFLYIVHWHEMPDIFFTTSYGISVTVGGAMGLIMWFNVWFIIWPNQKVIIAATAKAAESGGAPKLGNRPRVAFLASRINTMLSIPMLFFMGAASHIAW